MNGTFYRIRSPFEDDGNIVSWMVVSEDQKEALVGYYQVLGTANPGFSRILLKGLRTDYEYEIEGIDGTYFGDELMYVGLLLEDAKGKGDFYSKIYKLKAIQSDEKVGMKNR